MGFPDTPPPAGDRDAVAEARPFYSDAEARRQIGNLEAAGMDWKARAEAAEALIAGWTQREGWPQWDDNARAWVERFRPDDPTGQRDLAISLMATAKANERDAASSYTAATRRADEEQRLREAAEARVKELEAALAWRPIETAPKGERIWLLQMTPGDYFQQQCAGILRHEQGMRRVQLEKYPHSVWREEPYELDYWCADLGGLLPTHWMPLPPAPEVPRA